MFPRQTRTLLAAGIGWASLACVSLFGQSADAPVEPGKLRELPPAVSMVLQPTATPWNLATEIAQPIAEDRGAARLFQDLARLNTWASLMMIVAHPDDEDGAMLTYESRQLGVRASLLTLTRGEGGQNAMSADTYDALGVLRTNELLAAGEFYGVRQYWGTEADFGFSKTQEEAFSQWGHERVLCDTVLAVRRERPLVLVSSFIGGITDGHGQHQVSGEISQEAYLNAGDPKVCPEQIAAGLAPWSPWKVYARVPFAPITDKGMFDYATGKWAPAKFYNYVTKEWSTSAPKGDVEIPSDKLDPVLGRSATQIAREGWGKQKSQNGGSNPTLSGGGGTEYHQYGSRRKDLGPKSESFFDGIPAGVDGLTSLLSIPAPDWLEGGLKQITSQVNEATVTYSIHRPEAIAPVLRRGYLATSDLLEKVKSSDLTEPDKVALAYELDLKLNQFESALWDSLGLDLQAYTAAGEGTQQRGPFGGGIDESPRCASPGQPVRVRVHTGNAFGLARLSRAWLGNSSQSKPDPQWEHAWKTSVQESPTSGTSPDLITLSATVPSDAQPTEPYFTRPSIAQPYYDVSQPQLRGESFAPYPLAAWVQFDYDGVPIRKGEVVQTMQRVTGQGGVLQPLVITPKIGVRVEPDARILSADGAPLPVHAIVHTEAAADGKVRLSLPDGWTATPPEAPFHRTAAGDSEPITFEVKPSAAAGKTGAEFVLKAQAVLQIADHVADGTHPYSTGWQTVGYPGLRPYNVYTKAEMKTRAIDVKVARDVRVGYVMGTGDTVPDAIEGLGIRPHPLSARDLASGDLSQWDVIMIGIRAYSVRPDLVAAQTRLNAYVQDGGTLVVQYQSGNFPAPLPLSMSGTPERVVEESAPVKILAPKDRLLNYPNRITGHDFDDWVEERGHSFLDSWDPSYTALTETADAGQDPQRGGLLVTHPGKGTYVYVAYALYRQLPELVPGAYKILANLLAGKNQAVTQ